MPAGGQRQSADFKDRISIDAVTGLAADLSWAWPGFPQAAFVERASDGLTGLEMKGRVMLVADGLAAFLPAGFERAAKVIGRVLSRPSFDGWVVFPVTDWVARYGIEDPDLALPLLGDLTSRWTAEYAVRPFIEVHRQRTFEQFDRWIESEDEHRRRLVSEGSRPRLPWAKQLRCFVEDPSPTVALLDRLVDDPSAYVRKSVANHLNDISKDHPDTALATAAGWLEEQPASPRRQWVVSHGLRSLVKSGDPEALRLLGYDPDAAVTLGAFTISPTAIRIGEAVSIGFYLTAADRTPVMVDYAIHHAGMAGGRSPKVFKLKRTVLEPGIETVFNREHRIREVSVRRIHPGPHRIEVQVNGKVLARATVEVCP